jgi:hypothetical protein
VSAEDQTAVPDAPDKTEPETQVSEQETEQGTFVAELLKSAAEEGHDIGLKPPTPAEPPKAEETEPETETETETEDEPDEEEKEQPTDKSEKLVPLREVMEERAKKKRANERADAAEAQAAQLQAQLQAIGTPQPTEDDPFKDINDMAALDRLERSYEKAIDLADDNPDGAVDVVVGRDVDGKPLKRDFEPAELLVMRKKAEKAIRKAIPERRTYLQQRAVADAEAARIYPELQDPNTDFTKAAAVLANEVISGKAAKNPMLLVFVSHAVKGYLDSLKLNGEGKPAVKSPEARKIVEASKTKIAPSPTKTRSFTERGSGSANVEKARARLKEEGSSEAAEELVGKLLSGSGQSKRVEPVGE